MYVPLGRQAREHIERYMPSAIGGDLVNKLTPRHSIKCVVTINLSHSADGILRKCEVTQVGLAGKLEHLEFRSTLVVCSFRPLILQRRKSL